MITDVAQWAAPSCSRPQPATDNSIRDGRSNWLAVTPHPLQGSDPEFHKYISNVRWASQDLYWLRRELVTFGMLGRRIVYATTHGATGDKEM